MHAVKLSVHGDTYICKRWSRKSSGTCTGITARLDVLDGA